MFDALEPPVRQFNLQLPGDERIDSIADTLLWNPSEACSLAEWASIMGSSELTITRSFRYAALCGTERSSDTILLLYFARSGSRVLARLTAHIAAGKVAPGRGSGDITAWVAALSSVARNVTAWSARPWRIGGHIRAAQSRHGCPRATDSRAFGAESGGGMIW